MTGYISSSQSNTGILFPMFKSLIGSPCSPVGSLWFRLDNLGGSTVILVINPLQVQCCPLQSVNGTQEILQLQYPICAYSITYKWWSEYSYMYMAGYSSWSRSNTGVLFPMFQSHWFTWFPAMCALTAVSPLISSHVTYSLHRFIGGWLLSTLRSSPIRILITSVVV
jgi:hypothetical protein